MGDNRTDLPEGTDIIIDTDETAAASTPASADELVIVETDLVSDHDLPTPASDTEGGIRQRLRDGGERLSTEAGERARGLVTQGLERSSEALANVSRLVGDTAQGLDERLGPEFGEYARRAASAIESTANSIAAKDPDELIEDTRNFVRNSPGVAIAGAAIVGFALARLLKSGLAGDRRDDEA